jgi:hypothetical protein
VLTYFAPVLVIVATIGVGLVSESAVFPAFLLFALAAVALAIANAVLTGKAFLGIERLDEDGVIRIAGVSYETAQAIEKASGGKPVGSTPG